jgi:hypothetical protein
MAQIPAGTGAAAQSRRHVLRAAVTLATAALVVDSRISLAGRGWCRSDPLISIEGVPVDIFCTAHLTAPLQVKGPTEIVVSVPAGVNAALVLAGIGFGRGEQVRFEATDRLKQSASAVALEVAVYVPAKNNLAIGVEFAPRVVGILDPVRAEGFANQWITLATQLSTGGLLQPPPSDDNQQNPGDGSQQKPRDGDQKHRDSRSHHRRKRKGKGH